MPIKPHHRPQRQNPVQCSDDLVRTTRQAVANALAATFPCDPLFDPSLAKLLSTCGSIVKRHGGLIEVAIAEALVESGMEVWRNVRIPFMRSALTIVSSPDFALDRIQRITFSQDDIGGYFDADIVAVDARWACALQVRRGGGETGPVKRRRMEREIRAIDLSLVSWLRQLGFDTVETGGAALVDWLGLSGFSAEITLHGEALDVALGAPATAKIEAMSATLRQTLDGQIATLLRPVVAAVDVDKNQHARRGRRTVLDTAGQPIVAPHLRQEQTLDNPRQPELDRATSFRFPRPERGDGAKRFH